MVPAAQPHDFVVKIHQKGCRTFRVIPITSARIRYSRAAGFSHQPSAVASLDFEVSPFSQNDVVLDKAEIAISGGKVEGLTAAAGFYPPIRCRPRDDITLVYKLIPENAIAATSTSALILPLNLSLSAVILVSDDCHPRIFMQWSTNIDFSIALNYSFGGPGTILQRGNHPRSHFAGSQMSFIDSSPNSPGTGKAMLTADDGVTISFSGPERVQVGEAFHWNVFIVNRSGKPKRYAITALPRRKRGIPGKHAAKPSSSSIASRKEDAISEAVADENIIHATQKNAIPFDADLVCLSTDLIVG